MSENATPEYDMHPIRVGGVGAVRITRGTDNEGREVKGIEVWDGAIDASDPLGRAGGHPLTDLSVTVVYHAKWVLAFSENGVTFTATPVPRPRPLQDFLWPDDENEEEEPNG